MPQARRNTSSQSKGPKPPTEIASNAGFLAPAPRRLARTGGPIGDAFSEIGTSGLRQYGGYVLEEWLNKLQGRRAAWVWREMLDNDPTVGAVIFAIKWLARGVEWRVEEGNQPEAAEFVEECMHDMSHTWGDFVSEVLSFLPYGWSFHELVYKRRQGAGPAKPMTPPDEFAGQGAETEEDDSNPASSAYTDGKIGWRKIPVRAQETLLHWEFSGYSGISGMNQIDYHGGKHIIPIEKAVLFRTQTTRNNPEGRSVLRNAFTSYDLLKGIKQIEAIGIERDLAGIPMVKAPDGVDIFSPTQSALFSKIKQMVTGIRRDEYEGLIFPFGWEFELVSSGGSRQIDTDAIIRRYRQDIATSMLADFVLIGQDAVGSFAMVDVKSDLFGVAIDGVLDLVCEVMNRYAIPRLLAMNGMDVTEPPEIHHGSAGRIDLEKVGGFLFQLAGSGAPIPWSVPLLESLFSEAGLPTNFEEATEDPIPKAPKPEPDPNDPATQPVGPPKLTPGEEPFAREAHLGTAAPPPPAPAAAKPPAADPKAKAKPPVQKADTDNDHVWDTSLGRAINVAPKLQERHAILSAQLEQEITAALGQLGEQAASSFRGIAHKSAGGSMLHRLVGRVVRSLNLPLWINLHLKPILANHAGRVAADTLRTLQAEVGLEMQVGEQDAQKLADTAGTGLGMRDIEPQVRQSIMQAIRDGLNAGENPVKTADRIRAQVPAGRFVNAGAKYRSRLIARDATANLQRTAAIAAYRSNDHITGVQLVDGIYGPPRSDAACMSRSGQTLPIDEADDAQPNHPLCTLAVNPIVSGSLSSDREPALAA